MIKRTCEYCGEETTKVDYDYLVGTNHLSCALKVKKTTTKILPTSITISAEFILDTPNDQELGAKVRKLYYENNS
jgi:hypothetical protein